MKKDINLRDTADKAKRFIENHTFSLGGRTFKLSSALLYVGCLFCALLIWFNVTDSSAEISSRSFDNVSVVIEGESALSRNNMAVFELIDKTVSVSVEGAKNKVDSLDEDDIVAYINVSDVKTTGTVRLSVSVKGAGRLDTSVYPSSVKTFIDERGEKDVPVKVMPTYSITSNYSHTVSANIDTVTVTGAKSILKTVKEARSTPDLGVLTTSNTANSPIFLVDETGMDVTSLYVTPSVSNVVVKVEVYTEKTVPLSYSLKYGYILDKNIKVDLSPAEITLRGDPTVLEGIDTINLIEIDETKVSGSTDMIVKASLPSGVTDVNKTAAFNVNIELVKCTKSSVTFPYASITVKNPHGYSFGFKDTPFVIDYIVDSGLAKKVSAADFEVIVDLSSAHEGSNIVIPKITAKDKGFTLYPVNVDNIEVKIDG